MTNIKKIADLRVGDEIIITIRTTVIEKEDRYRDEAPYINTSFDYVDGECVAFTDFELSKNSFTVKRVAKPLPTLNGIYVPGNNADYPEGSFIYVYDEQIDEGPWVVYTGKTIYHGVEASTKAENAHNNLGGLIPLIVKGSDNG